MAQPSAEDKAKYSLYSALVFLIVSSPVMYRLVSAVFGSWVATNGCPTLLGLLLHSVVFGAVVFGLMFAKLP
jgi:hypothetical protein